jgi:hypothetical protein
MGFSFRGLIDCVEYAGSKQVDGSSRWAFQTQHMPPC